MGFLFLLHRNAFETHTMFKTLLFTTWINFSRSFLLRSSCDQCFGWGLQCSGQLAPRWSKTSSARLAVWKGIPLPSGSWSVITEREKQKEEGRQSERLCCWFDLKEFRRSAFFPYRLCLLFHHISLVLLISLVYSDSFPILSLQSSPQ